MPKRSSAPRIGNEELGRHRHVCGLFEDPDAAAEVLMTFVIDGLRAGDRVIHVVEDRASYVGALAATIDAAAAIESGQLDVRTWEESYVPDGTFNANRMLTYIRRSLREGQTRGFSATRYIGDMGWARDDLPGVDELVAYESELDAILARPRLSVVCAYITSRHSAGWIEAIVGAHQATFVNGRLQLDPDTSRAATPRKRILAAASVLFSENGTGPTGVDTLIEAAGVAKATFYRHFSSKDALIVAWLRHPDTRWFDGVRAKAEARASTPHELFPRLFEVVAEWLEAGDFVGCPYLNTSIEISDPTHPASQASREYLVEIGRYLEARLAAAGHPNAARLGPELHALLAGSISLGVANRTSTYALSARDAAMELVRTEPARITAGSEPDSA